MRVKRDTLVWRYDSYILQLLQLKPGPYIRLYLQHSKRLEILFLDFRLRTFGQTNDKRKSSITSGEHIHNKSRLTILDLMQHNGLGLCQHTLAKLQKKAEVRKAKG